MSLHGVDTLLFDLDGTVYLNDVPFEGVIDAINRFVRQDGHRGVALTNNSSKSKSVYEAKLAGMGLDVDRIRVVTPIEVGAAHLRAQGVSRAYIMGTQACVAEFAERGVAFEVEHPDCAIIAFDTESTYEKLARCGLLMAAGVPAYQTNVDLFCPTQAGAIPDCGSLAALLTSTTGVAPRAHFGKPGALMADYVTRHCLSGAGRAAMFGDRLSTDIAFGKQLGVLTVWVKTGDQTQSVDVRPDFVADTMAAFLNEHH